MAFQKQGNRLIRKYGKETLQIEPWGKDSLRVRVTQRGRITEAQDWALLQPDEQNVQITIATPPVADSEFVVFNNAVSGSAEIVNGRIMAKIDETGFLSFYNETGKLLLTEWWRSIEAPGENHSALARHGREFKPLRASDDYKVIQRFEPNEKERLYGMGQRQEFQLNLKGCRLELAQRNSQANIPFVISTKGYGFLWNNPAVGAVSFAANITEWEAEVTDQIDYWITVGDTPAEIVESYADATGKVPMMPDYATGFWQSKFRYQSREELMAVAREYKQRGLPISVIVSDFFHWKYQGDFKFNEEYWPDPAGMIAELREMGIELMVSVWPFVSNSSENFAEMFEKGLVMTSDAGSQPLFHMIGDFYMWDATNPDARKYLWDKMKKNYFDKGVRIFWLDEAEPDMIYHYDYELYRFYMGPAMKVANYFPVAYAKAYYEGQEAAGQQNIVNLIRCAWAGSQRYGALLWSGDLHSTFAALRMQISAGLNAGLSGIPWWTTDIGGFTGGKIDDPGFHELLIRWFQFGIFCPVTRLHGLREPLHGKFFDSLPGELLGSGAANEVWSYGEEVYEILKKLLFARERIRPYVTEQMKQAHEKGTPVMRPLFYDFPEDADCWDIEDEYMFGPEILVAPVLYEGMRERDVYLPAGTVWVDTDTEAEYEGGQTVKCDAPLDKIPVFVKKSKERKVKIWIRD